MLGSRCGGSESFGCSIALRCWSAFDQKSSLSMFLRSSIVARAWRVTSALPGLEAILGRERQTGWSNN